MTAVLPLPLHMSSLHGYESVLLAILAFGPFIVLAVVGFATNRRRERSANDPPRAKPDPPAARPPGPR